MPLLFVLTSSTIAFPKAHQSKATFFITSSSVSFSKFTLPSKEFISSIPLSEAVSFLKSLLKVLKIGTFEDSKGWKPSPKVIAVFWAITLPCVVLFITLAIIPFKKLLLVSKNRTHLPFTKKLWSWLFGSGWNSLGKSFCKISVSSGFLIIASAKIAGCGFFPVVFFGVLLLWFFIFFWLYWC